MSAASLGAGGSFPAPEAAPNAHAPADSLLMLVPVPAAKVGRSDLVVLTPKGSDRARVYRVRAVLSAIDHTVEVTDQHGVEQAIHLPSTTWRVSREVPAIGRIIGAIPGSAVSWVLDPARRRRRSRSPGSGRIGGASTRRSTPPDGDTGPIPGARLTSPCRSTDIGSRDKNPSTQRVETHGPRPRESETLSHPDPVRVGPRARAAGRRFARRFLHVAGSALVIVCVLVVFASLVGRAHVVPAPETARECMRRRAHCSSPSRFPRLGLHVGDVVVAAPVESHEVGAYRITAIDSWTHDAYRAVPAARSRPSHR